MDRSEGGRRRQKRLREYEAQESEEEQRILKRSARTVSEGCLMVRDERPDPDHLRFKLPQEAEVIHIARIRLSGRPDHKACADLIADLL